MKVREFKTIIAAFTLLVAQVTMASSIQDLVQKGNRLYDKGSFNEALKEYDQALIGQPQTLEPKFNKANCYFQLDDLSQAIDLYNEVAAESKDMKLVVKAKYNLGNSYFQRGSKQKDSNLQKALEDLQTSIVYWRSALEINPENEKAAKNIEVARLIIKDIIDQINKQKEQQQQQAEKQKQLQEQLKELAKQQKALAQKTQQTKSDADEGRIDQQQAGNDYQEQSQEQSQLENKTQQTLQQIQQQDSNNPQVQRASSELKQAADAQSDAEEQLRTSDGGSARKSQDEAVEHIENALKELSQGNQQNQGQQQEQQGQTRTQESNQPEQEQQQQEQRSAVVPDATAQEILNKEQQEKKQRQILQRGGYQKVEKDW